MNRPALLCAALLSCALTAQAAATLWEVKSLMLAGRYEEAEALLEQAPDTDPEALRLRVDLAKRKGNSAAVEGYARRLLQLYEMGRLATAAAIGQAAYAAWQLDRWKDANDLYLEAAKLGPLPVTVLVDWGNLYLEKYNAAEAESIFREAFNSPASTTGLDGAHAGLARALRAQSKEGSDQAAQKALELNPQNLEAFTFYASLALEEEDWKEAQSWIDKGLQLNRKYLPLLELRCALHYFREETERFQKTQQQVLEINPHNGALFEKLGEAAVGKRRLEEAVKFYRESIRRNSRQWSALAALGVNLLRLGEEEEGKRILEEAYANDPFNIWTVNTLRLLDSFDRFVKLESTHFSIRLHEKEAEALRPYVQELAERCLATLEQKYNHKVSGKYVLELYPDHEDFAVRTLGLPGLGALGATFGRIVAMDSPSARPSGKFHWGSTLWHEVAHVVTLSFSRSRAPRWLSEGISMMEERQATEGWGEYLTPEFVEAYRKSQLLPLAELNSGFVRPKSPLQLELSYFQAGWICEFLVSRFGFEKIPAMLAVFAQGKTTETAFKEILGQSLEEVDRQFKEELDRVLKPLVPRLDTSVLTALSQNIQEQELEDLLQLLSRHPESYFLNLRAGKELHTAGKNEEAIRYLLRALQLFPTFAGRGSPYDLLAKIYLERGEADKAIEILRQWWKIAPRLADNGVKLASLLAEKSELEEAAKYLEEVMYVNPLDAAAHQKLGELYLKLGAGQKAVLEFAVLLNLKPHDLAAAHYGLAQALFQSGQAQAARRQVLLSLEIAPGYEEAQKLLLKLVQP